VRRGSGRVVGYSELARNGLLGSTGMRFPSLGRKSTRSRRIPGPCSHRGSLFEKSGTLSLNSLSFTQMSLCS
jgi:hypothetical protein